MNGKRIGVEIKLADAPGITKSMHSTFQDLKLNRLFIIYPGKKSYSWRDNIIAIPIGKLEKMMNS